ncbi:putative F-box domain-containing protein [Tanacetum coccineum]
MADYIPLKLQAEIMKRLPVISLIRFRTVSKQWKSLIDSAKFIADHHVIQDHTRSQHHHRHLLLSCMERVASWGSVEYATIPNQVEVFSLSSGSWKRPSGKLPRKSIQYMYPQVAINEFIYWLAYDMRSWDWKYQYCHLIMSFDLTSEEFTEVYLPQNLASSKADVYISKLNESLVVLEKNHAFNANVWIMQDGDPKSFTHIFTINTPITSIRDVAGFRKNGEPLIVKKKGLNENELIVYEPNSKQINYTGIAGPFYKFFVTPYTQTLLLLDHKDSVDSETAIGTGKGTRSGHFRRVDRTLKGVSSSSLATSSSTSYYGASKRYSQEEVNEVVRKKCKRISASFNKKLVNLMTQLAEKGISLDKTPVVGEEDEEYEESDDEEMEDEEYEESDDEEYEEMEDFDDGPEEEGVAW